MLQEPSPLSRCRRECSRPRWQAPALSRPAAYVAIDAKRNVTSFDNKCLISFVSQTRGLASRPGPGPGSTIASSYLYYRNDYHYVMLSRDSPCANRVPTSGVGGPPD